MLCASCGQQNVAGAAACVHCAMPIPLAVSVPVRFPHQSEARHPERRQVTALFSDLVDLVPLTVRLDPEDMMNVIDAYLAACNRIIGNHGGYITQYMGDGVLAYFGYPFANEDDAANAVRTGLALRDEIAGLALPLGLRVHARLGIATGLVVVSDLVRQSEAREAALVGETPNLAARLQSIAAPDGVVVSKATHGLTKGLFSYRALGTVRLKGFADSVEAFEAIRATPVVSRFHARVRGKVTPLVGRQKELGLLRRAWAAACTGKRQVVLLQGEPGIGKSRLAEELRAHAADTPHGSFVWHCGPNDTGSVLHPITEQIARSSGFDHGDTLLTRRAKLSTLLAEYGVSDAATQSVLASLLGIPSDPGTPVQAMPPATRKRIILEALLVMLDRSVGRKPAMLVLEDAHWSDPTTLELMERAIQQGENRAWLILVTARPEYLPPWLNLDGVTHIQLGPLNQRDAHRICIALGAEDALTGNAVREIVARCDGNPLFVEEMTKSVLEAAGEAPAQDGGRAVSIPMSVQDSLVARLDRLGPARRLANLAAAIGRRFSYELLAAVSAQPEAALRQNLDDANVVGPCGKHRPAAQQHLPVQTRPDPRCGLSVSPQTRAWCAAWPHRRCSARAVSAIA